MQISQNYRCRSIDIVIYPRFKAIEAVATISVFEYANSQLALHQRPPAYDIKLASTVAGMVKSDSLVVLEATKKINNLSLPDTVLVVGARKIEDALEESQAIVAWLKNAAPRVERLVSLCSGTFFLAEAGLLTGKRATTHWSVAKLLKDRFPATTVDSDAIFINDGKIWTSAGVTAGIDLALALVEEDLGRDIALAVARDLVVFLKRPGGQSQFSLQLLSQMTDHPKIADLQDWILQHLGEDLSVPLLAKKIAMSARNFSRTFTKKTGYSPSVFIETARFEMARRLVEDAELPLKSIAARSGFRSEEQLRRTFQKHLGITPRTYRERFSTSGVGKT